MSEAPESYEELTERAPEVAPMQIDEDAPPAAPEPSEDPDDSAAYDDLFFCYCGKLIHVSDDCLECLPEDEDSWGECPYYDGDIEYIMADWCRSQGIRY